MKKRIKKFTTVNNWVCKEFIHCLVMYKWRQCCLLIHNTFELLSDDVRDRMLDYFGQSIPEDTWKTLYPSLPPAVRSSFVKYISVSPYTIHV